MALLADKIRECLSTADEYKEAKDYFEANCYGEFEDSSHGKDAKRKALDAERNLIRHIQSSVQA